MASGTRDYAKHSNSKRRPTPKAKSRPWLSMLILTAGLILLFAVALFHLHTLSKPHKVVTLKQEHAAKSTQHVMNKPRFEFYSILPKSDPDSDVAENAVKGVKQAPVTQNDAAVEANKKFLLQVAALKNDTEVDKLKAQLIMLGFNVQVQSFDNHGSMWKRVTLGPYATQAKAEIDQQKLKQNHFNSILRRV